MIELRDANAAEMTAVYFCEECETLFDTKVEIHLDYKDRSDTARARRQGALKKFKKHHEQCGSEEASKRIAEHIAKDPLWDADFMELVNNAVLNDDNAAILDEIKRRWKKPEGVD